MPVKIKEIIPVTIKKKILMRIRFEGIIKGSVQDTFRRILRKYGYPQDKQEKAIQTVMEQARLLAEEMV